MKAIPVISFCENKKPLQLIVLLAIVVAGFSNDTKAQGLDGIVVEKYYLTDAADQADAVGEGSVVPLPVGTKVYRVYVDMAPGYKFSQIYGNTTHNLTVNTTSNFYNDPNYGVSINPGTISTTNIRKHTAMIDSWFTTGGTAAGKVGVLKSEDTDGTLGNQQSILANNPGGCYGLPINGATGQDGMLPNSASTYLVPNTLGLGAALDALNQTVGNSIVISNGSIAALGGIVGATSSNMVLIAQFTTTGDLSFELNVQIVNIATGAAENYVSSDPISGELTHPTLTHSEPNVAPIINITSPTNNSNLNLGATTITADASDSNGAITYVEFFVDGNSIGIDYLMPYSVSYNATGGAHSITAIAHDDDCVTTTSSVVNFTVTSNTAPTITLTAPSNAVSGTSLTFTATASDSDGSVSQVEFFVNNISVGVDNTAPYSINYIAVTGSGQQITAVVTDNEGSTTTSNTIILTVTENLAPSVSITFPLDLSVFISPEVIAITAAAADFDGTVSQVEFFINDVSIGIDNSSPYTIDWISSPGIQSITAIATDNLGAESTSNSIDINVVDPNGLPYSLISSTQNCDIPTFCVPLQVSILHPVDNVIGFDVTLTYDSTQLEPTGNVTVYSNLIDPTVVDASATIASPGVLNISLVFNGNATGFTEFQGSGNLFCAEFTRLSGFGATDTALVEVTFLQESYISGVIPNSASSANLYSTVSAEYEANLLNWTDNSPIAYNPASPDQFLITNIYGWNDGAISNSSSPANPDLAGMFMHDLFESDSLFIERDMDNSLSVQMSINAADAILGKSLLNNGEFTPNIYQIISLDVNLDGVVSAGDISQINQRATSSIGEFQQAWNYSDTGVSNGEPSKDWIFVDQTRIDSDPAFQISSAFPLNDLSGYSAEMTPVVPFALHANVTNFSSDASTCPEIGTETYKGIMLGDVDGVIASNVNSDTLIFDLSQAILTNESSVNYIEIPVLVSSSSNEINALDFWFQFNLAKLSYVSTQSSLADFESYSFYNSDNANLRNTSSTASLSQVLPNNTGALTIKFSLTSGCVDITSADFYSVQTLLNGHIGQIKFIDAVYETPGIQVQTTETVCEGSEVNYSFTDMVNGRVITGYAWDFGNSTTGTGQNTTATYNDAGSFSVSLNATTAEGCVFNFLTDISIAPSPIVDFTASFDQVSNLVTFTNLSTIGSGSFQSYDWNFGDGNTSSASEPTHTYSPNGIYTASLTVTSDLGCTGSTIQQVDATVGVEEMGSSQIIQLYPNPANNSITLSTTIATQFMIVDAQGKVTGSVHRIGANQKMTLDISHLADGMYTIVGVQNGSLLNNRFIVQH